MAKSESSPAARRRGGRSEPRSGEPRPHDGRGGASDTEHKTAATRKANTAELLEFDEYDLVIVSFSGGKDSLACLLHLLDLGVAKEKIELWHQCVDGEPGNPNGLMDWPITEGYVKAVGDALGIEVRFQWKVGGFLQEMLREGTPTETVGCQLRDGEAVTLAPGKGKVGTRLKFPQTSADLSVRWCSAYLKIDVCSRAITNDPDLKAAKILIVTGERAEESAARAKYAVVERHRCHTKSRIVHQWRPVADWAEAQIWQIIERHNVMPHPAYYLGWGRVSCMVCIFGDNDQWATVRAITPARFEKIAQYEKKFGKTIRRKESVEDAADKGTAFPQATGCMMELALCLYFPQRMIRPATWTLPSGAYRRCGGPV